MKRIVIAGVLGSLLALSVASGAAAKQVIVGQLNGEVYPDSASTLTVIDQGSRLSARLRAIDAVFYPDSFGAELRQTLDVGCEAPTTDQCFGSGV